MQGVLGQSLFFTPCDSYEDAYRRRRMCWIASIYPLGRAGGRGKAGVGVPDILSTGEESPDRTDQDNVVSPKDLN
jgi:hypothetical protein